MTNKEALTAVTSTLDVRVELSLSDQDMLHVLEMAWLVLAQMERDKQLAVPGGFPEEQARQLGVLHKMSHLVGDSEPDIELERLWQEGDHEGYQRRLRELWEKLDTRSSDA